MNNAFGSSTLETGLGNNGFEVSLNYITGIPDPNHLLCSNTLKLAFKSLMKRDVNTKEKSITHMLEYIKENPSELNDDLVIITWVQLYPKLSIDDSKKVRSLSHQIQSQFVLSLGKLYAKYLKDTIGIWLSGLYDTDRSTSKICKESIYIAFGSNIEKISNLWKIFTIQILNYSNQVLTYETKDTLSDERFCSNDESEAKYLRVLQSSILLVVNTLNEINSIDMLNDNIINLLKNIFNQKSLYDSFSSKDFNLKKSTYMSFKSLISSKHLDLIIDRNIFKSLSKAMIKGIKFDSKINPLLYSNTIIVILDTLVCVTSYDALLWINTKKSDEKLLSLLRLGSLNSEPIYYDIVFKLLKILPSEILKFDDSLKFNPYFDALISSVQKEKSILFIEKGWKVLLNLITVLISQNALSNHVLDKFTYSLIKLIDSPLLISSNLKNLMDNIHSFANDDKDVLLDINSIIMDSLPNKALLFVDYDNYIVKNTSKFLESFIELLDINKSDLEEVLIANSIDSLEEINSTEGIPLLAFLIINIFIKKNNMKYSGSIISFINTIPQYITESFVSQPLETLILFSHSNYAKEDLVNNTVNETFIKLNELHLVNKLLKVVSKFSNLNLHEAKDLNDYLVQNSKSINDFENHNTSTLYEFLTLEILLNLYQNENFDSFISNSLSYYKNDLYVQFAEQTPEFLEKLIGIIFDEKFIDNPEYKIAIDLLNKLALNLSKPKFCDTFKASLLKVVGNYDYKYLNIKNIVTNITDDFCSQFLNANLLKNFEFMFTTNLNNLLSISNSLDLGLYFFVDNSIDNNEKLKNTDFNSARVGINKACFYSELLRDNPEVNENYILDLALIAEYASDILFLENTYSNILQEKIIEFQSTVRIAVLQLFKDINYQTIFQDIFLNKTENNSISYLLKLLANENNLIKYYSHRILKSILMEKSESLSFKTFEALDFKPLMKSPELLFVFLNSSKKYLVSKNLNYIRTNNIANLLNIKTSLDICTNGLRELILLNSFINIDLDYDIPENFILVTPQRCLILLNTITNWLETEIAYDEAFKPVRIAMIQFVQRYINGVYYVCDNNYPSDFINKIFNLGTKLLSETTNLLDNEDEITIDLLYYTLKLYVMLYKYKDDIESWEDDCVDTEEEFISLFFKFSKLKIINQPVTIITRTFSIILTEHIKSTTLSDNYDKFYNLINNENTDIQRIGCTLLHKLIPEVQDNLVVEFTLNKKKANEEGYSGIHLPLTLIKVTDTPLVDYIEFESPWKVYQYLWSWYLIMDHFKSITQQMRQDYINDLGEDKICLFLNFIFSELDLNKFKLHDDEKTFVKDYIFTDNATLDYPEEIRKILLNLVYEIMNNIGGTFAQNWFHSIKDRQLQQNIEKFIVRFISPELINDILSTLCNKNSIEDSEFKININRKTNEIKCLYNIDEQKMEISITLPSNFPLSQITVNGISRVGVDEKKWKSWIMSAQYVINFQNGTILDSIKHFKDNVTANFENYEDCAICYSILNAVDHSTPNKVCPTCKHNFHSACLYRWFKSSGASTCPLCRSKFNFKKHS